MPPSPSAMLLRTTRDRGQVNGHGRGRDVTAIVAAVAGDVLAGVSRGTCHSCVTCELTMVNSHLLTWTNVHVNYS